MLAFVSGVVAALAAWLSFGTIAFDAPGGARLAVLPLEALPLLAAVAAGVFVLALGITRATGADLARAIAPLVLIFLPLLPFGVPPAFLLWTGALTSLVWVAAGASLLPLAFGGRMPTLPRDPRVHARLAAVMAGIVFSVAAWAVSASIPGGDEPHYLVITQSLLYDGDIRIENNHQRGDYRSYFAGELRPDFTRRGRNGEIYSIHAPGLSAIVAPAFAVGSYHGVVLFLIVCSAFASGLAWWLAWRVSGSLGGAWFGWAAVVLSSPFLVESFTVYPDGLGAVVVLTGVWALLRAEWERDEAKPGVLPWVLHGLALALLPWMHTRFSVIAATTGGLVLIRLARTVNPVGKAIAFLSVPACSALAWLFFFAIVYGAPDPSAPYGGRVDNSFAFFANGAGGLLFDQGAGLLAAAPVLAVALAGWIRARRLALDWLLIAAPYFIAVATFAMWWAGVSGPARFLVPLLLPLAIPAACAWRAASSNAARGLMISALIVSCWLCALTVVAGGGRLAYHTRNETGMTPAPWFEWATHTVDVPSALPAFVPLPTPPDPIASRNEAARRGFTTSVVWIVCLGAVAWLVSRASPTLLVPGVALAMAAGAMVAASIAWALQPSRSDVFLAGQLDLLREAPRGRALAVDLTSASRMSEAALISRLQIVVPVRNAATSPDRRGVRPGIRDLNRPLATLPAIPAGEYRVRTSRHGTRDGWVMVGINADQFAIATASLAAFEAGVTLTFPVDIRALVVRADESARDQIDAVELQPIRLFSPSETPTREMARRAIRYGDTTVFFLDDRAFGEPAAFWIGGGRESRMVIATPPGAAAQSLVIRNAPVANQVTMISGGWRQEWALQPGEERRVEVPIDPARGAAVVSIRSAAGFRPSDADPANRDTRYLGVHVRVGG